jgi:hypothetical protein
MESFGATSRTIMRAEGGGNLTDLADRVGGGSQLRDAQR